MRRCHHVFLGRIGYAAATALQEEAARGVKAGEEERLFLLEHDPVITLGRNARSEDVLCGEDALRRRGVAIAPTDRGGKVTYHGPGQLVGYPILNLSPDRRDVARYLRDLEDVLIRTLARFGIAARRADGLTGVWVGEAKIASIGVHLSRWVTTHGFALNVSTDLGPFDLIVPCGLRSVAITSMQQRLGRTIPIETVAGTLIGEFATVFVRDMVPLAAGRQAISVGEVAAPSPMREAS
jgi:lipoyl(octanoyl) transferase